MSCLRDIAVVIPARNEAARIETFLRPLLQQMPERLALFVVVNNSDDATAAIAQQLCLDTAVAARISDLTLPPEHGVGSARRIGAAQALAGIPGLKYILTSDADCIVAPDWLARNLAHLEHADAVCGNIGPIAQETGLLAGMDGALAELEGRYRALVLEFFGLYAPEPANPLPHHGEASGASLAFHAAAYAAVGGFAEIKCGEDRDIVRRLKGAGYRVAHANDVNVRASLRLSGRAPGGMSDALRQRTSGQVYSIDECLPPPEWLWQQRHSLPVWPPEGHGYEPLCVATLPAHIARLDAMLRAENLRSGRAITHAPRREAEKITEIQDLAHAAPDPVVPDVRDDLTSNP